MVRKKKKLRHGEIFAVPLPNGSYIFGRILLDLYGVLQRRLLPHDTPLFPGQAYLVEMYSRVSATPDYTPSSVLIPGAYLQSEAIGTTWTDWPIVGTEPVDPRVVEFPETLIGFRHVNGDVAFCCGEIEIPVPLIERAIPAERRWEYVLPSGVSVGRINIGHYSAYLWPITCLIALGRQNDVPTVYKDIPRVHLLKHSLDDSDLRLSPFRAEIYKVLPFQMDQSYFEKQAEMGLNFERLYAE